MTLKLFNYSQHPFAGWRRIRVESAPSWQSGRIDSSTFWMPTETPNVVDVRTLLQSGDTLVRDFPGEMLPTAYNPFEHWPANLAEYLGGWPTVRYGNDLTPLNLITFTPGGGGFHFLLRQRIAGTRMMVVDIEGVWFPDQPWMGQVEATVTCSNPDVPDMTETLAFPLVLSFGDALVLVLGGQGATGQLVAASTMFGDGQARVIPLVIGWLRHMQGSQMGSFVAECQYAVGGHGIDTLLHDGNPVMAPGFNALGWAGGIRPESVRRIHTWDVGMTGPSKTAGDAGPQQGDQVFVGGEVMVAPQAELVRYLGALKSANYPQNHRESDGSPFNPALHTSRPCIFWHGRPHDNASVWAICEHLGKPRPLDYAAGEANGWLGMDPEHWLMNTLVAACRLFWSPACQRLLETQARIYPLQWTTHHGWGTSAPYASRAIGYEYMNVVNMHRVLDDRALAESVFNHSGNRWLLVTGPAMTTTAPWVQDGFWPNRISLWQQSVCAYGVHLWGRYFDREDARTAAVTAAQQVLDKGFHLDAQGRWHTYSTNLLPSGDPDPQASTIFDLFGFPLAPATVLIAQPANAKAASIRAQEISDATQYYQAQWIPALPQ